MNRTHFFAILAVTGVLCLAAGSARAVEMDWVTVGDPGNQPDTVPYYGGGELIGAVDYTFAIGKYEVTNAQYVEFLNTVDPEATNSLQPLGLYDNRRLNDPYVGFQVVPDAPAGQRYQVVPGSANKPASIMDWWAAARFCNWMHNGQIAGGTEDGAYTIPADFTIPNTNLYIPPRNADARFWLPSLDEWHKAAYYKGGSTDAGYWDYPTQSDSPPASVAPPGGPHSANYNTNWPDPAPFGPTDVGAYVDSPGPYGTFDMGGNVTEFNEWQEDIYIALRGGSYGGSTDQLASDSVSTGATPLVTGSTIGFRVATIPEPSSVIVFTGLYALMILRRRRR
jgi:formylglycine-generating enzyme required for sulfatase activity